MVSVSMFLLTLKCHSPSLVTQILTLLFQPVLPTEILEFLHSYSAPPTHTDPSPHSPPSILTPYDRLPTLTAVPEPNCCFLKLASLWVTSSSIADSVSQWMSPSDVHISSDYVSVPQWAQISWDLLLQKQLWLLSKFIYTHSFALTHSS